LEIFPKLLISGGQVVVVFKTHIDPEHSDPLVYGRKVPCGVENGKVYFESLSLEILDFNKIWLSENQHTDAKKAYYKP
jgi:hypothetical protein